MLTSRSFEDAVVLLSVAGRTLRRQLRPLAWVTLEEVALDAVAEDGRLVARTSARQVADRLGVDPGTAANALRVLRRHGLLKLEREHGPAGRFGLSVYVLGSIAGLTVVPASAIVPCLGSPSLEKPGADDSSAVAADPARARRDGPGAVKPRMAQPDTDVSRPAKVGTAQPARTETPATSAMAPAPECPGQRAFDLGPVSS